MSSDLPPEIVVVETRDGVRYVLPRPTYGPARLAGWLMAAFGLAPIGMGLWVIKSSSEDLRPGEVFTLLSLLCPLFFVLIGCLPGLAGRGRGALGRLGPGPSEGGQDCPAPNVVSRLGRHGSCRGLAHGPDTAERLPRPGDPPVAAEREGRPAMVRPRLGRPISHGSSRYVYPSSPDS
jgi:hypothetical protein